MRGMQIDLALAASHCRDIENYHVNLEDIPPRARTESMHCASEGHGWKTLQDC
jgi:hypothetical protein